MAVDTAVSSSSPVLIPQVSQKGRVPSEGFGHTHRRDAWWLEPTLTTLALIGFGIYVVWRVFENDFFEWGPYLSPFFSPKVEEWFPVLNLLPFAPALLVLWIPLGFRGTCYFYRRAYYRSFFGSPSGCAVDEGKPEGGSCPKTTGYTGESKFPFVLQNFHRYFFYFAAILTFFHWSHVIHSFNFDGEFGVGMGSLVLILDAVLLTLYTFSCHSWRHLLAGRLDCFCGNAVSKMRHAVWKKQSFLNEHHMGFAWVSMAMVGIADFYIRLVAKGAITDIRFF